MKKIIVEMSEQEYKKCKQIINELGVGRQKTNTKKSVNDKLKKILISWDHDEDDIDDALTWYKNEIKEMLEDGESLEDIADVLTDWEPLSSH